MNHPAYVVPLRSPLIWLVAFVLGLALVTDHAANAQGGGNANSVGNSLEASLGDASASRSSSGTPSGPPSGTPSGPPSGRSGGSPSGPPGGYAGGEGYNDDSDYGADYGGDYDDGSGYDAGYGGAARSAGSGAARAQIAMMAATQQIASGVAAMFTTSATVDPDKQRQLTLWEQAALAFHQGDQRKALSLYHAHIVAGGESANVHRQSIAYSRLLKRPVWCVRFGISIFPRVPDSMKIDPKPIRADLQVVAVSGRRGGATGQAYSEGYDSGGDEQYDSGDDGSGDERMAEEYGDEGSGRPIVKRIVTALGGSAGELANTEIEKNLGMVSDITKTLFAARQSAGKLGSAYDGMAEAGAALMASYAIQDEPTLTGFPMWAPGIEYVGEGLFNDVLAKAKAGEIDVLLHFDVAVKESRTTPPSYATRCRMVLVETGETLGVSKNIDKAAIASSPTARRSDVRAAVEEQLLNLFELLDKRCFVEPMPALQPQHAVARIEALLSSNKAGSIRSLAEMVMFQSLNLIDSKLLDQAFYYAGGEGALRLLHEDETDLNATVAKHLEKELVGDAE